MAFTIEELKIKGKTKQEIELLSKKLGLDDAGLEVWQKEDSKKLIWNGMAFEVIATENSVPKHTHPLSSLTGKEPGAVLFQGKKGVQGFPDFTYHAIDKILKIGKGEFSENKIVIGNTCIKSDNEEGIDLILPNKAPKDGQVLSHSENGELVWIDTPHREIVCQGSILHQRKELKPELEAVIDWHKGTSVNLLLNNATGCVKIEMKNPMAGYNYTIKAVQGSYSKYIQFNQKIRWAIGSNTDICQIANSTSLINLFFDGNEYFGSVLYFN